jgi:hypothetical protein
MRHSTGNRGRLAVGLLILVVLPACAFLAECPAETFEPLRKSFQRQLSRQSFRHVLFIFREDDRTPSGKGAPAEIQAFRRELREICRDEQVTASLVDPRQSLPETTLASTPAVVEWRPLVRKAQVDAVVCITWKETKGGSVVRVTLFDDSRVIWNGRAALRRQVGSEPHHLAAQQKGSGKTGAAVSPHGPGSWGGSTALHFPSGYTNQSLGLAYMMALGGGSEPFFATGMTAVGAAGGSLAPGGSGAMPTTELNAKILEFAENNIGRQVGNGQCYVLALEALAFAGADPPRGNDWGEEVALSELLPGDVLQFYSAVIVSPITGTWRLGGPGHTAIVGERQGLVVTIYQQNINGQLVVRKDELDLSGLVSGEIIGYRAVR